MKLFNWPLKGVLAVGVLGGLLLVGCGGIVQVPASVGLRGVNAIADLTSATIGANGAPLLTAGSYTTSGSFITFNSNPATGFVLLNSVGLQVANATVDTTTGDHFTAYASNTLATPHLTVIQDDLTAPTAGDGRVKFVNLSPAAATVDIYVTAPAVDISAMSPSLSGLTMETAQSLTTIAGTYEVRVTTAGTKTVVLDVQLASALKAGDVRTFLVLDNGGGGVPIQQKELNDSGT